MPRKLEDWLLAYEEYTQGNESPPSFHLWTGLVTIAGAAQRKISLEFGHGRIHTNMLVVLTGPAGGPRKSSAMDIGRSLLEGVRDFGEKIEIAPQKVSGASLISRMARIANAEHQSLTAYSSEFGSLIGANSTDVTEIITDLWDCKANWDKETVSRGPESITAPWLNILGATTPVWLGDNLPKTAVEGGFVSRALFIYEEKKARRVPIPRLTDRQKELAPLLVSDLADMARQSGTMRLDPEAEEYYNDWYMDESNFVPKGDQRMHTFYERKHTHMLKTAMAISLSAGPELLIRVGHVQAAIGIIEEVEGSMSMAFQGVGRNAYSLDYERIKRQILVRGMAGLPYKQILAGNIHAIEKPKIDEILQTMSDMHIIERGENHTYYPYGTRTERRKSQ